MHPRTIGAHPRFLGGSGQEDRDHHEDGNDDRDDRRRPAASVPIDPVQPGLPPLGSGYTVQSPGVPVRLGLQRGDQGRLEVVHDQASIRA